MKANARRFAANVRPIIDEIRRLGIEHNAIAGQAQRTSGRLAAVDGRMFKSVRSFAL
jgi:hypothetical protein